MIRNKTLLGLFWSEARRRAKVALPQPTFQVYDEPHTSLISVHLTWAYTKGHLYEGIAFRFSWDPGTKSFKYAIGYLDNERMMNLFQCARTPYNEGEFWHRFRSYFQKGDLITQREFLEYWHGGYYDADAQYAPTPAVLRDLVTHPYYVEALEETFDTVSKSVFDNPFKAALGGK